MMHAKRAQAAAHSDGRAVPRIGDSSRGIPSRRAGVCGAGLPAEALGPSPRGTAWLGYKGGTDCCTAMLPAWFADSLVVVVVVVVAAAAVVVVWSS